MPRLDVAHTGLVRSAGIRKRGRAQTAILAHGMDKPRISAAAYCVLNVETGKVLASKGDLRRRPIASLTKLITVRTSLLFFAGRGGWEVFRDRIVRVSQAAAAAGGTSAGLRAGDTLRVKDLVHGILLCSGNDAAMALAEYVGAMILEERGVPARGHPRAAMGVFLEKAREACLDRVPSTVSELTQLENAHGMDEDGHTSTARHVAHVMAQAWAESDAFRSVVSTKTYTCEVLNSQNSTGNGQSGGGGGGGGGSPRTLVWTNSNKLLWKRSSCGGRIRVLGGKTGWTSKAGPCLCSVANVRPHSRGTSEHVSNETILIVTLGSSSCKARWAEHRKLYRWAASFAQKRANSTPSGTRDGGDRGG